MDKNAGSKPRKTEFRDLGTREGFIGAIRDCGQYIIDHADGLLSEYPGVAISHMSITADFYFDSVPTVTVNFDGAPTVTVSREHIVLPNFDNQEV